MIISKQGFNTFSPIVCGFFDFAINCEILNDTDRTFSFDSNLEPLVPSFIFFKFSDLLMENSGGRSLNLGWTLFKCRSNLAGFNSSLLRTAAHITHCGRILRLVLIAINSNFM